MAAVGNKTYKGKWAHVEWIDLDGNGVLTECVIMKKFNNGDVAFFPTMGLDNIDRQRLVDILRNRNAPHYELWDLMSNITLGNAVNALEYFQQFTKRRTFSGQIVPFSAGGQVGAPGQINLGQSKARSEVPAPQNAPEVPAPSTEGQNRVAERSGIRTPVKK
jgi:hypothetical protein